MNKKDGVQSPDILRYTHYYEHDGMLRAYANRSMLLAMILGSIAVASLGFAIYVRIQPPTVIRVDKEGNAAVVGAAERSSAGPRFQLCADSCSSTSRTLLTRLIAIWLTR